MTKDVKKDVDNYSLDDTLAGRLVQAGLAAGFVAVPDFVSSTRAEFGPRAAVLASGIGLVAYLNAAEEDPQDEPDSYAPAEDAASPVTTWVIIGGVTAGIVALTKGEDRAAKWLKRRGADRPHTTLGALVGAVVFVGSEIEHRRHGGA